MKHTERANETRLNLGKQTELELILQVQNGDERAFRLLLESQRENIEKTIRKYSYSTNCSLAELRCEMELIIWEKSLSFDPSWGTQLSTYIYKEVKARLSKLVYGLNHKLQESYKEVANDSLQEEIMYMEKEDALDSLYPDNVLNVSNTNPISTYDIYYDDESCFYEPQADDSYSADAGIINKERMDMIKYGISTLNKNQRSLCECILNDHVRINEAAERLNMTEKQAYHLYERAKMILSQKRLSVA